MQIALNHPHRVRSMTLAGTGSGSERWYTETFHKNSRELAEALNRERIAIGYGDFYAKRCIEALGVAGQEGVVRIGLAHYNTMDEVERTIAALERLI
jgi:selenocysteine lyase/cysteine desulfurase